MTVPRYRHAAALLPDGRVLVTGGWSGRAILSSAEIYDPIQESWAPAAPMQERRMAHTMTPLPDHTLLVTGGHLVPMTERFDPVTGRFSPSGPLAAPRQGHTATLLPDGQVLLVGGYGEGALASAERFAPDTTRVSRPTPYLAPAVLDAFRAAPAGRVPLLVRWRGRRRCRSLDRGRRAVRRAAGWWPRSGSVPRQECEYARSSPGRAASRSSRSGSSTRQPSQRIARRFWPSRTSRGWRRCWRRRRFTSLTALRLLDSLLAAPLAPAEEPSVPWNISRLHAPDVWAQGITGAGVVVASIDTGVDFSHPAIRSRYRGAVTGDDARSWLDVISGGRTPYDDHGHGTRTLARSSATAVPATGSARLPAPAGSPSRRPTRRVFWTW